MVTMRAQEILDLVGKRRHTGMDRGRARAMRTSRELTPAQIRFLDELQEQIPRQQPTPGSHRHPEDSAGFRSTKPGQGGDLTPAELVWLQRLPTDPAQVSHADAEELARLFKGLSGMESPSSKRLVASIWGPVKQIHDRKAAEVEVQRAMESLPKIPNHAASALADAIRDEFPGLTSDELFRVATRRVDEVTAKRAAVRERDISQAERRLTDARESVDGHGVLSIDEEPSEGYSTEETVSV